jgi:hypothetical protein
LLHGLCEQHDGIERPLCADRGRSADVWQRRDARQHMACSVKPASRRS